jgi:hypothetical protein
VGVFVALVLVGRGAFVVGAFVVGDVVGPVVGDAEVPVVGAVVPATPDSELPGSAVPEVGPSGVEVAVDPEAVGSGPDELVADPPGDGSAAVFPGSPNESPTATTTTSATTTPEAITAARLWPNHCRSTTAVPLQVLPRGPKAVPSRI